MGSDAPSQRWHTQVWPCSLDHGLANVTWCTLRVQLQGVLGPPAQPLWEGRNSYTQESLTIGLAEMRPAFPAHSQKAMGLISFRFTGAGL